MDSLAIKSGIQHLTTDLWNMKYEHGGYGAEIEH